VKIGRNVRKETSEDQKIVFGTGTFRTPVFRPIFQYRLPKPFVRVRSESAAYLYFLLCSERSNRTHLPFPYGLPNTHRLVLLHPITRETGLSGVTKSFETFFFRRRLPRSGNNPAQPPMHLCWPQIPFVW
jgi:hypothetical protein